MLCTVRSILGRQAQSFGLNRDTHPILDPLRLVDSHTMLAILGNGRTMRGHTVPEHAAENVTNEKRKMNSHWLTHTHCTRWRRRRGRQRRRRQNSEDGYGCQWHRDAMSTTNWKMKKQNIFWKWFSLMDCLCKHRWRVQALLLVFYPMPMYTLYVRCSLGTQPRIHTHTQRVCCGSTTHLGPWISFSVREPHRFICRYANISCVLSSY